MSSCTWDYFLTSNELGKFLGIKEDDLKPILSRVCDFLATQQHYKRGKTETCEAVQRAWSAGGSRSSPGAESETVP